MPFMVQETGRKSLYAPLEQWAQTDLSPNRGTIFPPLFEEREEVKICARGVLTVDFFSVAWQNSTSAQTARRLRWKLNGYVNKQNGRIWSEANPQVYVETPLHPEKLTVWCALWAGGILLQKR
ncbi:hypothetical protein TNCV_958311 [Trichonephila clavipes]|nr:hypothetical protein TNCV_958311 [Trichonephila clavipes]